MYKIAITGSTGLIGTKIIELLKNDFQFIELLQENLDITNQDLVNKTLNDLDFDLLLHLAAYTNVDGAEIEKDLAFKINVGGTLNLFQTVKSKGLKFIYISTDFVFDGGSPPYFEDSLPHPVSYYGKTKLEGEKIIKDQAMIVRLSYPYRDPYPLKKDFVQGIINLLRQGKKLQMVTDSSITPTLVDDIAFGLKHLINNYTPDIFHLVGADSFSPFDAGKLIADKFAFDQSLIQPTSYDQYFKNKVKRPRLSEVKSKKNDFFKMKTFEEGLTKIKSQMI